MVKQPKSRPARDGGSKADERRVRLAAALRENLRKRKQQARSRADRNADKAKGD